MSGDVGGNHRLSLAGRGIIWLARLYQATLSAIVGRQCRFTPTCSEYFIEAARLRGAVVGGAIGMWRVLRCHPFGKGGYDPPK